MNIKDIVNRDIVNLTNCESEPIHIPGSIQPHGFLLGIKKGDSRIGFCSANSADYIGIGPEKVLGKDIADIFPREQAHRFASYANVETIDSAKPFVFDLNGTSFNTTVHQSGDNVILELEPFPDGTLHLPNLYTQTRNFVSIMENSSGLLDLCQEIADETRNITGYDRVMIYRFDEQYNGEVIAESRRDDLVSFANQKYPHTDIPAQARELYIRNPLRMIADINYAPVPLLTIDDSADKGNHSLDLSLSILRSVSPMHIEYLKNMGVGATLTISLLQNQKLWGLIACHHYAPKILPHYTRLSALLQGHFLTSQIAVREVAEEYNIGEEVDKALVNALATLHETENFMDASHQPPSLLKLANATGAAIYHEGLLYTNGLVPSDAELLDLFAFLSNAYPNQTFETDNLSEVYPAAKNMSKYAAGVIYHSMVSGENDGILWLRQEKIETINWAGNPDKAVLQNEDGVRLSPRKSFELWMEIVKDKSAPWRKSEINAASSFSYALQKHINFRVIRAQEDRNSSLNEELRLANRELSNLNWISTHDLKEPLRKIQIFASKVLDREDPDLSVQVKDSVERMRFAAEKMQMLIEDILAYSKAGTMEKVFKPTDLNDVLRNVLSELQDTIDEKDATVRAETLPSLEIIPFQVHQLFINLISNALKFVKPDERPAINITASIVEATDISPEKAAVGRYHAISFQDNGIGFEAEYESRIFDIFQRLHPAHKYPGTGIGLAICKKIMENHKGFIVARSVFGEGSVFTIYFPIA
ncbi:Bacteriophytochrome (light-regulated signal transduction histidine kinase) [Dyadobacter sp. SG02]|uniref:ATP-binding protein n=1 Tax=Dyadobacter sp. SG02 TaxID=1855291 RepID=UPI0008C56B76|nr:ATP-binding protein [Dyadobacter sp. SG02]SEI65603.1 Bacteriophytochrome (light-regulated signal transduction histidine kinase) [Dyadobacter sp. SG02]